MTQATTTLTCPKCGGQMRSYERSGVTIHQCADCRGIFLDRGELERLTDAEDIHDRGTGQGREQAAPGAGDSRGRPETDQGGSSHGDAGEGGQRKRRGGFLGDLLDFG